MFYLIRAYLSAYLILELLRYEVYLSTTLKLGRSYLKAREIIRMKFQNFVIFSFQVTINNCHYDM